MLKNLMMGTAALALSVTGLAGAANATVFKFVADLKVTNEVGSSPFLTGSGKGVMLYDDKGTFGDSSDDTYSSRVTFTTLGLDLNGDGDFTDAVDLNGDGDATDAGEVEGTTITVSQAHNHLGIRGRNGAVISDLDAADFVPVTNQSPLDTNGFLDVSDALDAPAVLSYLGLAATAAGSVLPEQGAPTLHDVVLAGQALYTDDDLVANLLAYAYALDGIVANDFFYDPLFLGNDDGRVLNADGTMDTNWYVNLHTTLSDTSGPLGTGHIRDQWRFAGVAVPEPASMTLLGAGIMGLGYFGKRRKA